MLRRATTYLLEHVTDEERERIYDPCSIQPMPSVLFRPVDHEERTTCVFTKYMHQFLHQFLNQLSQEEAENIEQEYFNLYSRSAHKQVVSFFDRMQPKPPLVFFQNADSVLLHQLDPILGRRTNGHNGTVIYHNASDLVQETKLANVNNATIYLGNERVLYVCTMLKGTDQLMELLDGLYSEQKRLVLVVGEFGHNIDQEEYKYIESIPIVNSEFTTSREWTGFQPYSAFCNMGLKLKTSGAFILLNDMGVQFGGMFTARISTVLLDGTLFNGTDQRLPNDSHPLLNSMLRLQIQQSDEPVTPAVA